MSCDDPNVPCCPATSIDHGAGHLSHNDWTIYVAHQSDELKTISTGLKLVMIARHLGMGTHAVKLHSY